MLTVEDKLQQRSSVARIVELDSLRGLAACVVILCHVRAPFVSTNPQWYLRPVFDGHVSVVLFFVLSGYVLSLPFWMGRQPTFMKYIVRRFFRIYVPYAAAVFVALLVGIHLLDAKLPLTSWFYTTWHTSFTPQLIASQFFAIDTSGKINIAFWSLRYEMEMSILMPLICETLRRLSIGKAVLFAFTVEIVGVVGLHIFSNGGWKLESSRTVLWASCFVLGALLARERDAIGKAYSALLPLSQMGLVALTLVAFYSGHDPVAIPGACGIVILAQNSVARKWLRHPLPEYLGRISYSLYLMHGTVIFSLLILLYGHIPLWALVCLYLSISVLISHIFCIAVEEPAMKMGKRLTSFSVQRLTETKSA